MMEKVLRENNLPEGEQLDMISRLFEIQTLIAKDGNKLERKRVLRMWTKREKEMLNTWFNKNTDPSTAEKKSSEVLSFDFEVSFDSLRIFKNTFVFSHLYILHYFLSKV